MHAGSHQSRDMRHVHHEHRAAFIRDRSEFSKIDHTRICAGPCHDQLRTLLQRDLPHRLIIDSLALRIHAIIDELIQQAAEVQRMPMRQMAASRQIHAQHLVSRLQHAHVYGHVRLCAAVRLHIGMLRAKQLFRTLTRQLLNFIHDKAAAIIPF